MKYDPARHHRRSIRLKGYDYSQAGAYFVTICTQDRECLFGEVVDGAMRLNDAGRIVQQVWDDLPHRHPGVALDAFVVMPNHVHGIIIAGAHPLRPSDTNHHVGAQFIAPATQFIAPETQFIAPNGSGAMNRGAMNRGAMNRGAMNRAPTLGEIVRSFKAIATRGLRQAGHSSFAWQRNYYEHIIRDDASLNRIREYIVNNPLQWALDRENPVGAGSEPAPTKMRKPPQDEPWRV